jgi:hypothetical protein
MPHDAPLPPVTHIDVDDLPLWLPNERGHRELVELIRDHWWLLRQVAELYHVRGVCIIGRRSAEERGNWPPSLLLRHRGQDYWFGEIDATCYHPDLQRLLDGEPRSIRVYVSMRGATARCVLRLNARGNLWTTYSAGSAGNSPRRRASNSTR